MKLLILGGTMFLGRHCVDVALARGHEVTLFTRGKHNPDLFPQLEKVRGDRNVSLEALKGRKFDAVIDTCAFFPRAVDVALDVLKDQVRWYALISTISVYADLSQPGATEDSACAAIEDPRTEDWRAGNNYGPLKRLCELAAFKAMPGRVLVVRPGLLVGPHDGTDRFTYWPHRVARGGEVLAPAPPDQPVQIIDARDLALFTVRALEDARMGTFHVTGPEYRLTLQKVLDTCKEVSGSDARFTWAAPDWLMQQGVAPWMELPLWIPSSMGPLCNLQAVDISKALSAGLTCRPLAETVRDTLEWDKTRPADIKWQAGMKPEREAELLKLLPR